MTKRNYILIENLGKWDLEKILNDFIKLYPDENFVDGIKLFQKKDGTNSFLISFTNQPDFEGFSFLVNYLKYPAGFKELDTNPIGFFKSKFLKNQFKFSTGEWNMIYVSKDDENYDNVSITTSLNESFLFDFGGGIKKLNDLEKDFRQDLQQIIDFNQVSTLSTKKHSGPIEKPKPFAWEKIGDIIAGIVCVLSSVSIFIFQEPLDLKGVFGGLFLGAAGIFVIWKHLRNKKEKR